MTFPLFDLNIQLNSTFVAAVVAALQSTEAELILVHATPRRHGLHVAGDYLSQRAQTMLIRSERPVLVVGRLSTDEELARAIDECKPGYAVFFPELRPSGRHHAVSTAAQFVSKGATVFATIHGHYAEDVSERLSLLWQEELVQGYRPVDAVLPVHRFISYAGSVQEVPVRHA
jgi:hypothetical protein